MSWPYLHPNSLHDRSVVKQKLVDTDGDQLLDLIAAEGPRLVEPEPRVLEDELEGEADEPLLDLLAAAAAILE